MANSVKKVRSSRKRCDYHVHFNDKRYYVWAVREGGVQTHYLNTSDKPPVAEEMEMLGFLHEQAQHDSDYQSCFRGE